MVVAESFGVIASRGLQGLFAVLAVGLRTCASRFRLLQQHEPESLRITAEAGNRYWPKECNYVGSDGLHILCKH